MTKRRIRTACLREVASGFTVDTVAAKYHVDPTLIRSWLIVERALRRQEGITIPLITAETKAARELLADGCDVKLIRMYFPKAEL